MLWQKNRCFVVDFDKITLPLIYKNNLLMIQQLQTLGYWTLMVLFLSTTPAWAQKAGKTKDNKEPKRVKVAKSGNSIEAIKMQLSSKTREEKNTMDRCPLHNKRMPLSDNYRADASDYTPGDDYPFAYQLNYRRYCNACTRVMDKEAKNMKKEDQEQRKGEVTFDRCEVHNAPLKGNPDYNNKDVEDNPSSDMPHARQYQFKNYCKICTKVYKIQVD